MNPQNSGAEVLSIRRTRREEIPLVLKKGGDVSAFEKTLDRAVREKAEVNSLVSKRSLEVRDLDETVTREEVIDALCIALSKPGLGDQCKLYKRFQGSPVLQVHAVRECKDHSGCQTWADKGEKDTAHASGSGFSPVFRAELHRLRGGK